MKVLSLMVYQKPEFKEQVTKTYRSYCRVSDSETLVFNLYNILLLTLFTLLHSQ